MRLTVLAGSQGLGAHCPPLSHAQKALGYGLLGLALRERKQRENAVRALKTESPSAAEHAETLFLLGLSARSVSDWKAASETLKDCAERFLGLGELDKATLAYCLALEALCSHGMIPDARESLKLWATERLAPQQVVRMASALMKWSQGELDEALSLIRSTPTPVDSNGLLSVWRTLFESEILIEKERFDDALTLLGRLKTHREENQHFDEAYQRTLTLLARVSVESLWQGTRTYENKELKQASDTVKNALGYVQNAPRYQGIVLQAMSQLQEVAGSKESEKTFRQAVSCFEGCSSMLDLAKALGRQTRFHRRHSHRPLYSMLARSRDLLTKMGATSWAVAFDYAEAAKPESGTSLALSRSISMMKLGEDEDVELRAVFEVNRAISELLEIEPLLQRILKEVIRVFKAERGALLQYRNEQLECIAAFGVDKSLVVENGGQVSFTVMKEAIAQGKVLLSDNAQLDTRFQNRASVMATDIRSVMCAPLNAKSGNVGVIYLDSRLSQRVFKPQHSELMEVFATQAATAIENAQAFARIEDLNQNLEAKVKARTTELELANSSLAESLEQLKNTQLRVLALQKEAMEKELILAKSIQEQIVPARGTHIVPGAKLNGTIETATQVGGDFWTYVTLPENNTLLLMGDVTGHGVAAGMLTTVARAAVDTLTHHLQSFQLTEVIETLSEVLFRSSGGRMTMTTFALLLQPEKRICTVVNAGHTHPFWLKHQGGLPVITPLKTDSLNPALGSASTLKFASQDIPYNMGDRFFLYTDGLLEGNNPLGKPYGIRRIQKALVTSAQMPIEQQISHLMEDSQAFFAGAPQEDDISMVVMELL